MADQDLVAELRAQLAAKNAQLAANNAELAAKNAQLAATETKMDAIRYEIFLRERKNIKLCIRPCKSTEYNFRLPSRFM
jgi:capsule polysaccharide export protein KpsE/RkpR